MSHCSIGPTQRRAASPSTFSRHRHTGAHSCCNQLGRCRGHSGLIPRRSCMSPSTTVHRCNDRLRNPCWRRDPTRMGWSAFRAAGRTSFTSTPSLFLVQSVQSTYKLGCIGTVSPATKPDRELRSSDLMSHDIAPEVGMPINHGQVQSLSQLSRRRWRRNKNA